MLSNLLHLNPVRPPQPVGLNAPFGARCFLTRDLQEAQEAGCGVLMHLLAFGAFWQDTRDRLEAKERAGLNAPFGARCFLTYWSFPKDMEGVWES